MHAFEPACMFTRLHTCICQISFVSVQDLSQQLFLESFMRFKADCIAMVSCAEKVLVTGSEGMVRELDTRVKDQVFKLKQSSGSSSTPVIDRAAAEPGGFRCREYLCMHLSATIFQFYNFPCSAGYSMRAHSLSSSPEHALRLARGVTGIHTQI